MLIFLIVLLRLGYRLTHGAPPSDRSLPAALTGISHLVHWTIYLLLVAVPIGGYIGVSYYGALNAFNTVPLPPVTEKDEKMAEVIFGYHKLAALVLLALVACTSRLRSITASFAKTVLSNACCRAASSSPPTN